MKKMYQRFFYGTMEIDYQELVPEIAETTKKKIYSPQFEKIGEVVKDLYDQDFKNSEDKILINTIMVTQMARYYWVMGNFEVGTRTYEKQYNQILVICRAIYGYQNHGDDLEFYFSKFTTKKVLDDSFLFPKKEHWYTGSYDPWQYGYAKDLKSLEKKGYADSELWSVDYVMMAFLVPRVQAFIRDYEDGKFCIIIEKEELTRFKDVLKFIKKYSIDGAWCYSDEDLNLLDKRGRVSQKKVDAQWAEFGHCMSRMWW